MMIQPHMEVLKEKECKFMRDFIMARCRCWAGSNRTRQSVCWGSGWSVWPSRSFQGVPNDGGARRENAEPTT